MASVYDWDVIAANNANADGSIDWAEGMSPANVNDSARVMMGRVKELLVDLGGSIVATGTANVIAITAQSAFTTLANGRMVSFRAIANNTQATTLNVNATGAKPVLKATGSGIVALTGREIQAAAMYTVQYSAALNAGNGAWLLLNPASAAVPAGAVSDFAALTAPEGWLLCYGQAVSRTTYADLFAAIGTTFGAGDGSTTFNLPDLRGRVTAGQDNMGGTAAGILTAAGLGVTGNLGQIGGNQTHTLTVNEMPSHSHGGATGLEGGHSHSYQDYVSSGVGDIQAGGGYSRFGEQTRTTSAVNSHSHSISSQGGSAAHPIVQPTMVLTKIIKF